VRGALPRLHLSTACAHSGFALCIVMFIGAARRRRSLQKQQPHECPVGGRRGGGGGADLFLVRCSCLSFNGKEDDRELGCAAVGGSGGCGAAPKGTCAAVLCRSSGSSRSSSPSPSMAASSANLPRVQRS
jgi:hypothetical protein